MKKYRKRPVVVEAVQWDGPDDEGGMWSIKDWGCSAEPVKYWSDDDPSDPDQYTLLIPTKEGMMGCPVGSWIVKDVDGKFYVWDNSIFEKTYEPVEGVEGEEVFIIPPGLSSNIAVMRYSLLTATMQITFRSGAIYRYTNVGESIWLALINAKSVGSVFNHLKKGLQAEKLDD